MATFFVNFLFLLLLSGFPALFRRNCLLPSLTAFAAGETSPPSAAEGHRPVLPKAAAAAAAAAADGAASRSLLDRVLAAMEMGLEFMEREEEALNLDAIIGSRIVEGQLTVLMMRLEGTENNPLSLPTETVKRIESIRQLADRISTKAIPSIKRKQPIYYNRLSAILRRGFWALSYGTRRANTSAVVPPIVDGEAMNEEESDDCLTELFGTGGETQERCRVSVGCWRLMTQPGFQHYALTHQVFYTEIGTSFGCFSGDLRKFTDELSFGFCANILVEAEAIASANFPYHKTDLFMEQAALCGVLGFREFFRPHWLEAILLWQRHPDGCWGENHSPRSSMRYRREERVLVGGCRCHRTAVALGALVGYVRFLSESVSNIRNSPNENHHHHHYHHQHHHHHHHHQQQQ